MKELEKDIEILSDYIRIAGDQAKRVAESAILAAKACEVSKWHSVAEKPATDSEKVVVKTNSGAMYFASTINGQFMSNVVAWFPLPK